MKHLLACTMLCTPSFALADTFYTNLPVDSATIYPQGALVMRKTQLDLPAGEHQVVMALPSNVAQTQSLKIDVQNATPQSLGMSQDFLEDLDVYYTDDQKSIVAAYEQARDDLADLQRQRAQLQLELSGLIVQANYLQNVKPSLEAPQTIEELQAVVMFLPTALAENAEARTSLQSEIDDLQFEVQEAEAELRRRKLAYDFANLPSQDSLFATLTLKLDQPGAVEITGQNFTGQAGWQMKYDLSLSADETTVTLDRVANITQATSEAWHNAAVTLSSAKPFQQLAPILPGRDVVELINPSAQKSFSRSASLDYADEGAMMEPVVMETAAAPGAPIMGSFDGVAVEYPLPARVSLQGRFDAVEQVELSSLRLDAATDRYASPRRDTSAFVRSIVTNTTGEPILSGPANYYRGDNLINSSRIELIVTGAEETLYFGPDESLPLTMQFLSELSGDAGFITRSNTRREEMAFEIENLSDAEKTVTLVYALPISVEEDVQLDVTTRPRPDRTLVDGVQGRSEWDLTLPAGARQTFGLAVNVTWPENSEIRWEP